jgi:hypothetical protein|tara:strand:- start:339 stop:605 length:267 start_codon:yes stop_codon:yes gene_type:complete
MLHKEAEKKARVVADACLQHVEGQAQIVDSQKELVWDGPFTWHVATLRLPDAIDWDGVGPLEAVRAWSDRGVVSDSGVAEFIDQASWR